MGAGVRARRWFLRGLAGGASGLLLRGVVQAQAQTVQYGYDALGRVVSVTHPNGHVTTYAYDAAGNRTLVQSGTGSSTPPPPPASLAVSVSATNWSSSAATEDPPVQVSVTGGTPPYAYAWQRVSGNAGTLCLSTNSSSTTWWFSGGSIFPPIKISTWRCQITDSASGSTFTPNVSVTIDVS